MRETVAQLINELAEALVFLDPGDLAGCGQLLNIMDKFGDEGLADEAVRLKEPLEAVRAIVIEIIYNEFSKPEEDLESLNRAVSCLQETFRGGDCAESRAFSGATVAADAGHRRGDKDAAADAGGKALLSAAVGEPVPASGRVGKASAAAPAANVAGTAAAAGGLPPDTGGTEPQFAGPLFAGV
ncbi:MAG: hypothetical protein JW781_11845, partial [Deltaproteobacteria bacterium]|nr:hypothetical protein [Candidatus Anaeroferrophillacea bacterium]